MNESKPQSPPGYGLNDSHAASGGGGPFSGNGLRTPECLEFSRHRSGVSANTALIAAILWSAVVIVGAILWKQWASDSAADADKNAITENQDAGDDAATVAPTDDDMENDEGDAPKTVTITFPSRPLPDFELEECMGETFGLQDLLGKRWVASFVFTRCASTCPTITLAVKKLHDRVGRDNTDVMFVTMTVDSKYDSAEILQRYSETYSPDRDRWKFLTGDMDVMHELIVNGFGLYVKENLGDDRISGFEVAHSNRVVLVNEDGIPVGTWLATVDSDMADLSKVLTGRKPFPEPSDSAQLRGEDGLPARGIQLQAVPVDAEDNADNDVDGSSDATRSDVEQESQSRIPANVSAPTIVLVSRQSPDVDDIASMSVPERLARMDRLLPDWAKRLPTINALLNMASTMLLSYGWVAIRGGRRIAHRNAMISAFVVSVLFLGCYLTSHWALGNYTDERGRLFSGGPIASTVYYLVLVPHIVLAATVPFFAVRVFQHAFAERWDKHRRLASIAFPVWMYVSVTGVIIYGMLYHWPDAAS